jgi:hypothetical protein
MEELTCRLLQVRKVMSSPMSYRRSPFLNFRLQTAFFFLFVLVLLATSAFGQQPQVLLGDTNVEWSLDKNPSGTAEAFPVRAWATGQVNSLSVYLDSSNTASPIWVGMYTSANRHPHVLLSNGMISNPLAGQWNSVILPPVQVTGGTTYWLALLSINGVVAFRDRNGKCRSEVGSQTDLGALPATWATGSTSRTCILSMFATGSAGTGSTPPSASVTLSPSTISLQAGQQQQFAAAVTGMSNPTLTWTSSGGTITSAGLYTAPSSSGTYTVTANAATSTTVASGSAVVTVTLPSPPPVTSVIQVSVSPTTASLQTGGQQQFLALVSGTSNTAVTWSAASGTITANGLYTAPSAAGTDTITAVSNADTTKSAAALVVVSAPVVAVTVSPANASVVEANQVQFAATVSGVSNQAVTWAVSKGNGAITQSGVYTAPSTAENDVITATSQADNTKSANASITVLPPHSVSLDWGASPTTTVAYYKVYRGTVSGGPYNLLGNNIKTTSYTDSAVQSGAAYYYVTTAVDASGGESAFSNEFPSVIPSP